MSGESSQQTIRPRTIEEELIVADRIMCAESLLDFVQAAWHLIEPSKPFVGGWHLEALCEHLEAVTRFEIKKLVINIHPRLGKSTLTSVLWPAWVWLNNAERRFLFSSYAASLSIRDSVRTRRVIESNFYQRRWGDKFTLTTDQNTKTRFDNDRTGFRICTSVGGAATGEGGDYVIVDDPHNLAKVQSDTVRESDNGWWDTVMSTRTNDAKKSAHVVIMQRAHERDLSGHVLEQGGYEHLCIPAEYDPDKVFPVTSIGWKDPRKKKGELVCPERFPADFYAQQRKRLGSYNYAGQYDQRPSPAGGGIYKRGWWRYYSKLPTFDRTILSVDCAFKELKDSDFVVIQAWGLKIRQTPSRLDFYLLDQLRARMGMTATAVGIKTMQAKWNTDSTIIEDKANGPAVVDTMKRKIRGLYIIEPKGGKLVRARATEPVVEAGQVLLPEPHPEDAPWVNDFIEEHAQFPKGANDDQVDAQTQAILFLTDQETEEALEIASPISITRVSPWK